MTDINTPGTCYPGDRFKTMIWTMALQSAGQTPMPSMKRVNTLKRLAADWLVEDKSDGSDSVKPLGDGPT